MILIDTNVLSELRKGARANPNVLAWSSRVRREKQFLSVLSLGEIRKGIEQIRGKDPEQALALDTWLSKLAEVYMDETIPVCGRVAEEWGRMNSLRSVPVIDGLLAATAKVHGLRISTRNEADFDGLGIEIENPFAG